MNKNEQIIKKEAYQFFKTKINRSRNVKAIDDFHELKSRLNDFYSPENKAVFLDEVHKLILDDLIQHRKNAHGGKAGLNCPKEEKPEKLIFYINQELDELPKIAHQAFKTNIKQNRNKVFVSYSHFDKDFLIDIKRHFKPFLKQIDYWDDSKIKPGQRWKEEIRKAIDETKIGILLVSTDFLGSDFIATNELPPLLKAAQENGAVILTVILKPCLFEEYIELNQYQAMNPPSRPVIKMDDVEKEELLVNLVRQTKRILNHNN